MLFRSMAHIGKAQLFIFTFTIVATLLTDLLLGIVAGVIAKLILNVALYRKANKARTNGAGAPSWAASVAAFFKSPVTRRVTEGDVYHLHVERPLVCFNTAKMLQEFDRVPAGAKQIEIHLDPRVGLIDHTSFENLHHTIRDFSDRGIPVKLAGLNHMRGLSEYHAATHVAEALSVQPS